MNGNNDVPCRTEVTFTFICMSTPVSGGSGTLPEDFCYDCSYSTGPCNDFSPCCDQSVCEGATSTTNGTCCFPAEHGMHDGRAMLRLSGERALLLSRNRSPINVPAVHRQREYLHSGIERVLHGSCVRHGRRLP